MYTVNEIRFHFLNSQVSILLFWNAGFHNFEFSCDTNVFSDEDLKSFFTEWNSEETPFSESDHPVKWHQVD